MISIIGGGPAGCYTAYLLASSGKDVSVFEEHNAIGKPVQCAGIVTSSLNNIIKLRKNTVINKITRARIFSQENFVEARLENPNLILDRQEFDSYLAEKAINAGAKIFLNHRFIGNEGSKVITSRKTIDSEAIIGADGPLSKVARINNMYGKRKLWQGIQARAKLKNDNVVEFYPNLGAFAWVVPENKEVVRIGMLESANKRHLRGAFHKFVNKRLGKNKIIDHQAGIVPVYNPKQITQKNNIYLVGDAAGQVKATTAGGIIQCLTAAEALADSIINKKSYEKEWRKQLGNELLIHLKMRKIMDRFSENDMQFLIRLFNKKRNKAILNKYDRDYPSRFFLKMVLREPRLLYFLKYLI